MLKPMIAALVALTLTAPLVMAEEIVLRYAAWNPREYVNDQPIFEEFQARHPNVRIETVTLPEGVPYWVHMRDLAERGELPDLMMMNGGFLRQWAPVLYDIDSLSEPLNPDDFYAGPLDAGVVEGHRAAVPRVWVAPLLYYNKTLFEAAGVETPDPDWSWPEFREAALALTRDLDRDGQTDQWGAGVSGAAVAADAWVFRNGGRYINADMTAFTPNREAINALTFLADLAAEGALLRPGEASRIEQRGVFAQGRIAMLVDGSWGIDEFRHGLAEGMEWDIAQVPFGPDATVESERAYAWGDYLSISANSPHPELAWELIRMMIYDGRSGEDFLPGRVPAYREIALSRQWHDVHNVPENRGLLLEIGEQPVYDERFSANYSRWRGNVLDDAPGLERELDRVLNGDQTLDAALQAVTPFANELLNGELQR